MASLEPPQLAPSLSRVQPSRIRQVANEAFSMDGVLALHFGESNLPTPTYIQTALTRALEEGYTFYSPNGGTPSLRAAIAQKYAQLHAIDLSPDRVLITASGVQALNMALRCLLDPGDQALILSPNWPNGTEIVRLCGADPVEVAMRPDSDRFRVDFDALEQSVTPRTRLLLYTSPSNPLGWVATREEQRRLLQFCRRHRIWLVADEVYERICYRERVAPSILRLATADDAVLVVQSFSKSYRMTGWRLGWLVGPAELIRRASELNEYVVSHAPTMIQRAGESALAQGDDDIYAMVEELEEQRAFATSVLDETPGVVLTQADGAFYLFPRIEGIDDSLDFALRLLRATGVAVAPGSAFGSAGEGYIRICYAPDRSILEPALERLNRFMATGRHAAA